MFLKIKRCYQGIIPNRQAIKIMKRLEPIAHLITIRWLVPYSMSNIPTSKYPAAYNGLKTCTGWPQTDALAIATFEIPNCSADSARIGKIP